MPQTVPHTPPSALSPADSSQDMPFFNSLGQELQQALCANETEPMEHRVARLEGVRDALAEMGEVTSIEGMLRAQMLAAHYTVFACLKGAGTAASDPLEPAEWKHSKEQRRPGKPQDVDGGS